MTHFLFKSVPILALGGAALFLAPLAASSDDATGTNVSNQTEHGSTSATADAATASTHPSPLLEENLQAATPGQDRPVGNEPTEDGLVEEAGTDSAISAQEAERGGSIAQRAESPE